MRFVLDVVEHGDSGNVKLKDVARRQAISEKYLWQVVTPLKAAGIVNSVMGPGGGYTLAKPLGAITLRDILEVLEGDQESVRCLNESSVCARSAACVSREIWRELDAKLAAVMDSITLKDMVDRQRQMAGDVTPTYCI